MALSLETEFFKIQWKGGDKYALEAKPKLDENLTKNEQKIKKKYGDTGLLQSKARNYFRNKHASEILKKTVDYKRSIQFKESKAVRSSK